ncbi:cytochrome p450 [Rhyzopertha dominica]|nr:cytochrome p450 [Rhyzopertha dominica]
MVYNPIGVPKLRVSSIEYLSILICNMIIHCAELICQFYEIPCLVQPVTLTKVTVTVTQRRQHLYPTSQIAGHVCSTALTMLAILIISVLLPSIIFSYFQWKYTFWRRLGIPYLKAKFPMGCISNPLTNPTQLGVDFANWHMKLKMSGYKYGGVFMLCVPVLVVTDLELIKNVLVKDFSHFMGHGFYVNEEDDPLSANLLSVDGQKWKNLRAKLSPTFTSTKIKVMFQTFVDCSREFEATLSLHATKGEAIDVRNFFACFTTDVIGSCAFGIECNSFKEKDNAFRKYGDLIFENSALEYLKQTFMFCLPDVSLLLRLTNTKPEVSNFFLNLVKETVNDRINNRHNRNDLLQLLIDISGGSDGFTLDELAAQVYIFFLAGFETSSTILTFCLFELSQNQKIQDRLRSEVEQILEKHGGNLTYDALKDMKYMDQVIDEALRKYPPLPVLFRECTKDYTIPETNVLIKEGTKVAISTLGLQHDPEYFPDPEVFDPERFSPENKERIPNLSYIPFGEGPRICIGLQFGRMQTKVGLVASLRNFRFFLNPKTKTPIALDPQNFVVSAQGSVWLDVKRVLEVEMGLITPCSYFEMLAFIVLLVVIVFCFFNRKFKYWGRRGLPYLEPKIPFGNTVNPLNRTRSFGDIVKDFYDEFRKRGLPHGGVFLFTRPIYVPVAPELIKRILVRDFPFFIDRGMYHGMKKDPLCANLLAMKGTKWQHMRSELAPTFTSEKMKFVFPTLLDCCGSLTEAMARYSETREKIDIKEVLDCFTTDVIGSCAFGLDCNSFKDPDSSFRKYVKSIFTVCSFSIITTTFLPCIYFKISPAKVLRDDIVFTFPALTRLLRLKNYEKEQADFFINLVKGIVEYREKNNVTRKDFMQLLMDLKKKDRNSDRLTIHQIASQAFMFFVGGFETSSVTMSFCLYELSINEDIQKMAREEVRDVLEKHSGKMTYEAIQDMKYLGQVVDETLRKYPPQTMITRMCSEDYPVEGTSFVLKKGTGVMISILGLHRDPEYFPNPEIFDPNRFSDESRMYIPSYVYMPFGEGPKICIGRRFGMMLIKIGLATLLKDYEFSLNPKTTGKLERITRDNLTSRVTIPTILICVLLPTVIFAYFQWKYTFWKRLGIPYLEPKFPLGCVSNPLTNQTQLGVDFASWHKRLKTSGSKYGVYMLCVPVLVITDLELIKKVLVKDFAHFMDHGFYANEKDDQLSAHLLTVRGQKWKSLRAKLTPTFTSGKMKMMFETLVNCSRELEAVLSVYASNGEVINIKSFFARFTTDVIGSCAFGIECNSFKDQNNPFRKYGNLIFENSVLDNLKELFLFCLPKLSLLLRFKVVKAEASDFFLKLVTETVNYRNKNSYVRNDFLQILIDMKNSGESGELTLTELAAQVFIFFVAGFETSSTTGAFCLFELSQNQEVQDRVRDEIELVLKRHDGKLTYEALKEMKYMDQVVDVPRAMMLTILICVLLATVIFAYFQWKYTFWKRLGVPYLEPKFPLGCVSNPLTNQTQLGVDFANWYKRLKRRGCKYGGVYMLCVPVLVITDLELIKKVLVRDFAHFMDHGFYANEKDDPLSAHLLTVRGQKWKSLRAKLTPTFTSGKMKMMFETLVNCSRELEAVLSVYASNREVINIKNFFVCFTTDVIGSCAFGIECNSFKDQNNPFRKYGNLIFENTVLDNLKEMFMFCLPELSLLLRFKVIKPQASDFFMKLVNETVNYRKNNNYIRNDFLQLLIDIRNGGESGGLTLEELAAQVFIFFVAGFETSSTTGAFCLFELSQNQEVQDRVRNEIELVLNKHDEKLTYESVKEMKYMDQVVDETLRKYPALSIIFRECTKDYVIPETNTVIRKGTKVTVSSLGLHHDPEYFPDPDIFDPDRFSPENKERIPQFSYIPFGEGPRNCIGLRFGKMQTKVGLVASLRKYRFSLNPRTKVPLVMDPQNIILSAQGDVWLDVKNV